MKTDSINKKTGNLPRLKAVNISSQGELEDRLIGIQLEFTGNISSPIFSSEGMKEESLIRHTMYAQAFVTSIAIRVDGNSLNEIKLRGKKELVDSGMF